MQNNQETKKPKKPLNSGSLMKYSGMGLQMAGIMLLGAWGGMQIDKKLGIQNNIFTAVLTIIAVFLAVYLVIKDLLKK